MLAICIANLSPSHPRLTGAITGEAHAQQVRKLVQKAAPAEREAVILDFTGVESASASYLKRLLNPFFLPAGEREALKQEIAPIAISINHADLHEDLEDYLNGKERVLILADIVNGRPRFNKLLGRLDGAAAETFAELRKLKQSTAAALYARHRDKTTNQTAWNNRLVQLVDMRIARRSREGRFWVYQPTVLT